MWIVLGGLIGNLKNNSQDYSLLKNFSEILSTKVLQFIPRDKVIAKAEYQEKTVVEYNKNSSVVLLFKELSKNMLNINTSVIKKPTPISNQKFYEYAKAKFVKGRSL